MIENFGVICPGCKAENTLVYQVTEVKSYPLIAMASQTNPDRGTYYYQPMSKDHIAKTTRTRCSIPECNFDIMGPVVPTQVIYRKA